VSSRESQRDHEARTSEIGDVDLFDDEDVKVRARYVVAGNSDTADECQLFWRMLGIHQQEPIGYDTGVPHLPNTGASHALRAPDPVGGTRLPPLRPGDPKGNY
jgi:hypothetical protein